MDTEEQQRAKGHPTENLENSATGGQQPLNENETINPTEVIETMEVHKHPQLHHKPKPWKEYLLEGLMIFIAVMMGFLQKALQSI